MSNARLAFVGIKVFCETLIFLTLLGIITGRKVRNGQVYFRGNHTKGANDGKWVTYKDYSYEFLDYTVDKFRLSPNVYDIMDVTDVNNTTEEVAAQKPEVDVYLSYCRLDCPSFLLNELNSNEDIRMPPSYQQAVLQG